MLKCYLGSRINRLPYTLLPKIGRLYNHYRRSISNYNNETNKKEYIFSNIHQVVEYALNNIEFYRTFYKSKGFTFEQLQSFDDISKIPLLTKGDLLNVPIDERSVLIPNIKIVNTGGSTGVPLSLYKSSDSRIKEMAFYHSAWSKLGYSKDKIRMQFVGRQKSTGLKYELARNEFRVSVYEPFQDLLKSLSIVNKRRVVEFIQGYPSVIYEFALYCMMHPEEYSKSMLNNSLKGIFFNSEYPQPLFLQTIKDFFCVPVIASYGHTEGVVLAFDYGFGYMVNQAYGYAEAVEMKDGVHLVGTTYDNFASPLIRYDTDDLMDDITIDSGILQSFKMTTGGRIGQYVEDKEGKKLSLTGLIFGKHHDLFDYCSQLQVSQKNRGEIIIYYVPIRELPSNIPPSQLFDSAGLKLDISFKKIDQPIKTTSGKVLLLVDEL